MQQHDWQDWLNFRDDLLNIFQGKPARRVVFQPRIDHWIAVNEAQGTLPEEFRGLSPVQIHARLECSIRPYGMFNPCLITEYDPTVKVEIFDFPEQSRTITRWTTPVGTVESIETRTALSWHIEKFPVDSPEAARVYRYVLAASEMRWDQARYERTLQELGTLSVGMIFIPRVNVQQLIINLMGFEATVYAIVDGNRDVLELIRACDEADERTCRVVAGCPVIPICYGDNLDCNLLSPRWYERFVIPQYERRREILKPAGKFVYSHWDGSVKTLLQYARRSYLDGIEALTPWPQGDVSVDEIKEALGDEMVLLDGLPMLSFMPNYPREKLEQETHRLTELFGSRLVLGISDELSPVCDIEKVRFVAELVKGIPLPGSGSLPAQPARSPGCHAEQSAESR